MLLSLSLSECSWTSHGCYHGSQGRHTELDCTLWVSGRLTAISLVYYIRKLTQSTGGSLRNANDLYVSTSFSSLPLSRSFPHTSSPLSDFPFMSPLISISLCLSVDAVTVDCCPTVSTFVYKFTRGRQFPGGSHPHFIRKPFDKKWAGSSYLSIYKVWDSYWLWKSFQTPASYVTATASRDFQFFWQFIFWQ